MIKKKIGNGGFSLLELVVSVALLAIVSVMLAGLLSVGAKAFRSITGNINLQTTSQIVMAQVREYAVDCEGISGDCLTFTKNTIDYTFSLDGTNLELNGQPLARNVTGFAITRTENLLHVTLELQSRGSEHIYTQYIALRNFTRGTA